MKILLVEDDEHKMNDIITYLKTIIKDVIIDTAYSIASGVGAAIDNQYDIILLDMNIPNFDITETSDGGKSYKNGGEIIVKELLDEDVDFRCAIVTQYETFNNETIDQIGQRMKELCGDNYFGYVKYSTSDNSWKDSLKKLIEHVENTLD
ncbi:MAG: response regulator [Bacteroidales bacterium]|nr:response regulator [Bacteroidales bacterium]